MIINKVYYGDKECTKGYLNGIEILSSGPSIPDNLQLVEYVGSTNYNASRSPWVDTDIAISNISSFDCKAVWTSYASGTAAWAAVFGASLEYSPNSGVFMRMRQNQGTQPRRGLELRVGDDIGIPLDSAISLDTVYEVIGFGRGNSYTVNGVSYPFTKTSWTPTVNQKIILFGNAKRTSYGITKENDLSKTRIYYLKFYDENEKLINSLVPVRYKDNSAYGFYDLVTKTLYDVPTSYHEVGPDVV